jgi:hypothetical protein
MGYRLIDQYSLLHFAVGIIVYFWGISLPIWFIVHTIFEIVENTQQGIYFINNVITLWPGGKPKADTMINQLGDSIFAILGWILAYYVDEYGKKWHLY